MIQFVLEILFPTRCIGCKKEDTLLCTKCRHDIAIGVSSHNEYEYIDTVFTSCKNSPLLRKMVHSLKYKYKEELVALVGGLMLKSITNIDNTNTILVPVPLHFKKQFQRGFNQAEVLSKYISSKTGIPTINLLKRIENTKSQARLNKKERVKNMRGVFKIKDNNISTKTAIIIDDVLTTGSTIDSCARELKENGFEKVYGICLCRGL